jgi:hypothetical protein
VQIYPIVKGEIGKKTQIDIVNRIYSRSNHVTTIQYKKNGGDFYNAKNQQQFLAQPRSVTKTKK